MFGGGVPKGSLWPRMSWSAIGGRNSLISAWRRSDPTSEEGDRSSSPSISAFLSSSETASFYKKVCGPPSRIDRTSPRTVRPCKSGNREARPKRLSLDDQCLDLRSHLYAWRPRRAAAAKCHMGMEDPHVHLRAATLIALTQSVVLGGGDDA